MRMEGNEKIGEKNGEEREGRSGKEKGGEVGREGTGRKKGGHIQGFFVHVYFAVAVMCCWGF